MNFLRFPLVVCLLLATEIFLVRHDRAEIVAPRQPLASFPLQLGSWQGSDVSIAEDVRQILGPADVLARIYQDGSPDDNYVDLFIAYFASQRFGDTIHSPKNCLPGAGWLPLESGKVILSAPGYAPFVANRYVVAKGDERQLVVYWYLAHGRAVASEYWARYYLFSDSIAMNRSDGSLIRLVTPVRSDEQKEQAQQRLLGLAEKIIPQLDNYIPR